MAFQVFNLISTWELQHALAVQAIDNVKLENSNKKQRSAQKAAAPKQPPAKAHASPEPPASSAGKKTSPSQQRTSPRQQGADKVPDVKPGQKLVGRCDLITMLVPWCLLHCCRQSNAVCWDTRRPALCACTWSSSIMHATHVEQRTLLRSHQVIYLPLPYTTSWWAGACGSSGHQTRHGTAGAWESTRCLPGSTCASTTMARQSGSTWGARSMSLMKAQVLHALHMCMHQVHHAVALGLYASRRAILALLCMMG